MAVHGAVAEALHEHGSESTDDVLVALWGDVHHLELHRVDLLHRRLRAVGDDLSERLGGGDDNEADGMDGGSRAWRQNGTLDTSHAAVVQEVADVLEVAELRLVGGGLGARRKRHPDLRDDQPDVIRGDLNPRVALDRVERPDLDAHAGHEQVGLVAGLTVEGDQAVALLAEALGDETDLARVDRVE